MQGFIYILTNPSIPGQVKIGRTTRRPDERAAEIDSTGIPTPFVVAFAIPVQDCVAAERRIHKALRRYRTRKQREFFVIDVEKAIRVIEKECKPGLIRLPTLSSEFVGSCLAVPAVFLFGSCLIGIIGTY